MANLTADQMSCDDGSLCGAHVWVETYYGTECSRCGTFYAFGCEPWADINDHDEEHCVHGVVVCDGCLDCDIEEHELEDIGCDD